MTKPKLKTRAKPKSVAAKDKREAQQRKVVATKTQAQTGASPSLAASVFIRNMKIQGS